MVLKVKTRITQMEILHVPGLSQQWVTPKGLKAWMCEAASGHKPGLRLLKEEKVPMEKTCFTHSAECLDAGLWILMLPGVPRWLLPWVRLGAQQGQEGALKRQESSLSFLSKPQTRKIRTFSLIQGPTSIGSSFPVKKKNQTERYFRIPQPWCLPPTND